MNKQTRIHLLNYLFKGAPDKVIEADFGLTRDELYEFIDANKKKLGIFGDREPGFQGGYGWWKFAHLVKKQKNNRYIKRRRPRRPQPNESKKQNKESQKKPQQKKHNKKPKQKQNEDLNQYYAPERNARLDEFILLRDSGAPMAKYRRVGVKNKADFNRLNKAAEEYLASFEKKIEEDIEDKVSDSKLKPIGGPVVVYTMAKVGTLGIGKALESKKISVVSKHTLHHTGKILTADGTPISSYNTKNAIKSRQRIVNLAKNKKIRLITGVRDPVERALSAYFYRIGYFSDLMKNNRGGLSRKKRLNKIDFEKVKDDFLKNYSHNWPLKWFDNEIKIFFNLDVFRYEFNYDAGYTILQNNNCRLLILRTDKLSDICQEALGKFLKTKVKYQPYNEGSGKWYGDYYKKFKKQVKLPNWYLNKIYNSKLAKHFFTEEEVRKMKARWR